MASWPPHRDCACRLGAACPNRGIYPQSIERVIWKPNRPPSLRDYGMSVSLQLVDPLDPSSHWKDTVPAVAEANVRLDVQRSPSS